MYKRQGLTIDQAFTIADRDVTLTCLLADGSPFSIELDLSFATGEDFFDSDATLTVTLVPAVGNFILGDVNQDGAVTFADIPAFIEVLTAGMFVPEADTNQDGELTFADIPGFIEILTAA